MVSTSSLIALPAMFGLCVLVVGACSAAANNQAAGSGSEASTTGSGATGPTTGAGGGTGGAATTGGSGGATASVTTGAGGGTSTGNGGGTTVGSGGSGGGATSSAQSGTGGSPPDAGLDPDAACAAVSSVAKAELQPADIILAVDTSGSMSEEAAEVQQNLANFSTIITNSGIDAHVVLIADDSVCIPPPLGSGSCPNDDNLPKYRHVHVGVGSTNALEIILAQYPAYKPSLRVGATKTIAVVSDDDSDMGAAQFMNQILAIDPPTFQGFKYDAIVAFEAPNSCIFGGCVFNCGGCQNKCCNKALFCAPMSAAEGTVHKQLAQMTGGILGDLCAQDFDPMFQGMATAIVQGSSLSCEYAIPPPPPGVVIDPGLVNVNYTLGGQPNAQPIFNVAGLGACGGGGWYYDNPVTPTKIIMCPSTCTTLQNDPNGKVEVLFGCETLHQ